MITLLVLLVILVNAIALFVLVVLALVTLVLWLQSTLLLVLGLGAEASLGLAHLIEFLATNVVVIFEDFILLIPGMLVLQLLNDSVGLLLALRVLQVVHVELVFEVVNIRVFLYVNSVEPLQLLLQTLILFLVLGLNVFNALKAFLSSLKFLSASLDLVLEFCFVLAELFDGVLHFAHFALLGVNNVTDAFLNVLLLRIGIQISRDRIKEFNCIVTSLLKLLFVGEHVEQFGATLSNFSGQLTGCLQVLQFG